MPSNQTLTAASRTRWLLLAGVVLVLGLATTWWLHPSAKQTQPATAINTYADPATCLQCHQKEAKGYSTTGMAHAFYAPTAATTVDSPSREKQFLHTASSTYYSIERDGGGFSQKRWQQGFDGKPENVEQLPSITSWAPATTSALTFTASRTAHSLSFRSPGTPKPAATGA